MYIYEQAATKATTGPSDFDGARLVAAWPLNVWSLLHRLARYTHTLCARDEHIQRSSAVYNSAIAVAPLMEDDEYKIRATIEAPRAPQL